MDYPREFSPKARARVEAERLRATRDYERKRDELPSGCGHFSENEQNLRSFILRGFLAFCREACDVGLSGLWTVDKIRAEADEFLRRFTIEAYYDYGHDRGGHQLPEMTSNWGGNLKSEVEREFRKSAEWHTYEDELLAVADKLAKRSAKRSKLNDAATTTSRRAEIEAFIGKLAEHGRKVTRKNIWTVAGYQDRTEFERFQRGDSRVNEAAITSFSRVLKMSPEQFLKALDNQK